MITVFLLMTLSLANSLSLDLDGDGKADTVTAGEDAVRINKHTIPCGGAEVCILEAHDINSSDKQREVGVCEVGPRDDKSCRLFTLKAGALVEVKFPGDLQPPKILTSGNNVVLTESWQDRIYYRIEKYELRGASLAVVKQPHYVAGIKVKVERTFPIVLAPDGKVLVGNARPDSEVDIVVEHGEKPGWYLVKLSSGIAGWVQLDTLVSASDHLRALMSAG